MKVQFLASLIQPYFMVVTLIACLAISSPSRLLSVPFTFHPVPNFYWQLGLFIMWILNDILIEEKGVIPCAVIQPVDVHPNLLVSHSPQTPLCHSFGEVTPLPDKSAIEVGMFLYELFCRYVLLYNVYLSYLQIWMLWGYYLWSRPWVRKPDPEELYRLIGTEHCAASSHLLK